MAYLNNKTILFAAWLWLSAGLLPTAALSAEPSGELDAAVAAFVAAREVGETADAEMAIRHALELAAAGYGETHPNLSFLLEAQGGLYADAGRWAEAEAVMRRALAIRQAALGDWHLSLAALYDAIGDAVMMQDRPADAEAPFRRALAIRERSLPPGHPDIAMSLDDLATLYHQLGRFDDEQPLAERAEAILVELDRDGHFTTAAGDEPEDPSGVCGAMPGWCASKADAAPIGAKAAPTIERFPAVEAPKTVAAGVPFAVVVSLNEDALTPEVRMRAAPGVATTADGGLRLSVPASAEGDAIDVVLSAPGFQIAGGSNLATLRLPRQGDSTPALFQLVADPVDGSHEPRKLSVTLWRQGAYLARLTRAVTVSAAPAAAVSAAPAAVGADVAKAEGDAEPWAFDTAAGGDETAPPAARPVRLEPAYQTPDLTVFLFTGAGQGLERAKGEVIVHSPHLQVSRRDLSPTPGLAVWLEGQYAAMHRIAAEPDADKRRERSLAFMRGFGVKLWREFVPDSVQTAFWRLRDQRGAGFRSIQIYTDDPTLPWELMRPSRDGQEPLDFLGVDFRIARWHVAAGGIPLAQPPQAMTLRNLLAVTPAYAGRAQLPEQAHEMAALAAVSGFRQVGGDYRSFAGLIADRPDGVIHFSGHGQVRPAAGGGSEYAIMLSDGMLDLTTWRGLAAGGGLGSPLFFFNACDVGRADRVASFVDGWAPAVLEAGASGYIGGLWPLTDSGAYDFAASFYTGLEKELGHSPAYLTELLRQTRARFYQTGDPTYLAYGFYGDVNLRVDRDWAAAM